MYTEDQKGYLKVGAMLGLDISIYSNPELTVEQMNVIIFAMTHGVDMKPIAKPEYSINDMWKFAVSERFGKDYIHYIDEGFNWDQIQQIKDCKDRGLDATEIENPKLSHSRMNLIKVGMLNGVSAKLINNPDMTIPSIELILDGYPKGFNYSDITTLTHKQYDVLKKYLIKGIDVRPALDLNLTPQEMNNILKNCRKGRD